MRMHAGRWVVAALLVVAVSARGDLLNVGFETNSGAGGSADWWSNDGRSGVEDWAGAHGDTWQMAIYGWDMPPDYGNFHQDISGSANHGYTFSIWINKDDAFAASTVDLLLEWYDSGSALLGSVTNSVFSSLSSSWQEFSVAGTAPVGTETVRVLVDSTGITAGGAVKFDDAMLSAVIPEPGTFVAIVLGLLGMIAARRRTRRT